MKKTILTLLLALSLPVAAKNTNLAPKMETLEIDGLSHDFASASDLREQLSDLQASEQNLKAIVKKQRQLIETYEKIIEKLKKQLGK